MNWLHANYILEPRGSAAYISKLRQHLLEVSQRIDSQIASDNASEDPRNLVDYRRELQADLQAVGGGVRQQRVRFGR